MAGLLGEAKGRAQAQADKLIIGVMGDQSRVVADAGGQVLGRKVELVAADHQN